MASHQESEQETPTLGRLLGTGFRWLASLELAVILIVVLAGVLAWTTFLEADKGSEYAGWYVYGSQWFIALLALLAVNVLASAVIRFPWKTSQIGFLITHAGLVVLLVGAMQTFLAGIDGQLGLVEGETGDSILLTHRSQLKVVGHGETGQLSTELSFSPGPIDWGPDDAIDFGWVDGVRVRVLRFLHHARQEVSWVADDSGEGEPALKLALIGSNGQPLGETWCVASPFGGVAVEGQPRLRFQQAPAESITEDFLDPPSDDLAGKGLLSVHHQGKAYPIAVDDNVGKEVPLGDSGLSVKIVEYYANAVAESGGFRSMGTKPKNPMLQLEIHLPDEEEPIAEIAYARNPFVNYELMRGVESPVKFWYHHPDVPVPSTAEFLQTPDEKLYCRVGAAGKYQPRGEVKEGDRIKVSEGFDVSILRYFRHARQDVTFSPIELAEDETNGAEAAALVELTAGGRSHQIWLRRNDPQQGFRKIETAGGPLLLTFRNDRLPLGFSLKLLDFEHGLNPGRMGDASFASKVQLVDEPLGIDRECEISMNEPLTHGKFTFYQSGFKNLPDGTEATILSVAHDPGRLLKYSGSVMICLGIFVTFYMRAVFRRKAPASENRVNQRK